MRDLFVNSDTGEARSPEAAAQEAMRPKLIKRFYKNATTHQLEEGLFAIQLDAKNLKTPARRTLTLPSEPAARIVADEWQAQEKEINPATMPATRLANTGCDGVVDNPKAVIEEIVRFASSDLLCYRVDSPSDLVALQNRHWNPILEWSCKEMSACFKTTSALMQIAQSSDSIAKIATALGRFENPVTIAALHTFTSLTGSVIIALALANGKIDAEQAWEIAHVDENWNISKWGEDFEAERRRAGRWLEMQAAFSLFVAIERL